jgi:hypothetical protein
METFFPRLLKEDWVKKNKSKNIRDSYSFDMDRDRENAELTYLTLGVNKDSNEKFAIKIYQKTGEAE